jgi:RNA polymerase sigma-70 factor (ECF subfamily)
MGPAHGSGEVGEMAWIRLPDEGADARLDAGPLRDRQSPKAMTDACPPAGKPLVRLSGPDPDREDAGDFESFFAAHRPALVAFLRRRTANEADAEEIAQESYVRLLGYGYGDSRPAAVWRALLYRIAGNLAVSHFRMRAVRQMDRQQDLEGLELASEAPSQERMVVAQQELAQVRRALAALPPKCRKVFVLSRVHHKSYPEIARLCGISVKMVEKHMSKALAALRHAVEVPK